ncbi:MAG: ATP-binding protein [Pseudobdellovibrio sp.]
MKNKILRKYIFILAITLIFFVVMGFLASGFLAQMLRKQPVNAIPPLFIAKVIDQLDTKDRLNAVHLYEQLKDKDSASNLVLYNSEGEVVYKRYEHFPVHSLPPDFLKKFIKEFDTFDFFKAEHERMLKEESEGSHLDSKGNLPSFPFDEPPPVEGPEPRDSLPAMRPHERHMPPFPFDLPFIFGHPSPPENTIVRLSGQPIYYVGIFPRMARPQGIELYFPILGPVFLLLSLIIGVIVAINLIYASVRKRIIEADKVISEIQKGNLNARFKVERKDEFGEAMLRFNTMADEIQALVEHLKFVESARNKMLQELAHDLRTPVASLKNLLETISTQNEKLTPALQKELSELSLREVDYFEKLVEDLLLLAQVEEPKYKVENSVIDLSEIIEDVLADCASRPMYKLKDIKVAVHNSAGDVQINGNQQLIYRLFRNIFENSLSFARSELRVDLKIGSNKKILIEVQDDGPGLTDEQIRHYGEKKLSRKLANTANGERLSVGLGSVIIKKIVQLHRGHVSIRNKKSDEQKVTGSILTLELEPVNFNS